MTTRTSSGGTLKNPPPLPHCRAFADSKTLTETRREALLAQLQADPGIGFRAESLSAAFISGRMLARDRHSLNELANDSTARLIAGVVAAGVNLTHAYIDTVGDADKHRVSDAQWEGWL